MFQDTLRAQLLRNCHCHRLLRWGDVATWIFSGWCADSKPKQMGLGAGNELWRAAGAPKLSDHARSLHPAARA